MFVSAVGPVAGMLTNTYGHRLVAMVGGLCATIGLALSAVASNVYHLIVTFGILTGIYVFIVMNNKPETNSTVANIMQSPCHKRRHGGTMAIVPSENTRSRDSG